MNGLYIQKTVYSAFCGTGKSWLCSKKPNLFVEVEGWKYQDGDFPDNCIQDIEKELCTNKKVLIDTNPIVLKKLFQSGIKIKLFYPNNNLKNKYINNFIERGSSKDFIELLNKNWDKWIDELKEQQYCEQIVLGDEEYLELFLDS